MAILTISVIAGDTNLTPEGKFEKYVEYMSTNADMLSAIESEVARYCFFDRTHEKNIAFKNFSEVIRDNFIKGGKAEKKLMKALNPARDIMYYRAVAMQSSRALDGKVQDTWLVTADDGLKNLSQSIYFLPGFDGSDSKAVKFVRNQSQKQSSYWRYCDALFEDTVLRRMGRQSSDQCDSDDKKQFQRLFDCIAEQEARLRIASI